MDSLHFGFLLHILIENPASMNFFVFPSNQLDTYSPQAHAVIRQYAILLLASVLISSSFLLRPIDQLSGQVAGALCLYHIAPSWRSINRLQARSQRGESLFLSQAAFYLFAHTAAGAMLAHCCYSSFLLPLLFR